MEVDIFLSSDLTPDHLSVITAARLNVSASAPDILVQQVITRLKQWGGDEVIQNPGVIENTVFAVPIELR